MIGTTIAWRVCTHRLSICWQHANSLGSSIKWTYLIAGPTNLCKLFVIKMIVSNVAGVEWSDFDTETRDTVPSAVNRRQDSCRKCIMYYRRQYFTSCVKHSIFVFWDFVKGCSMYKWNKILVNLMLHTLSNASKCIRQWSMYLFVSSSKKKIKTNWITQTKTKNLL